MENPITIREIIKSVVDESRGLHDLEVDHAQIEENAVQQIKQKMAHMRRVLRIKIEKEREETGYEVLPDKIVDIVYEELDILCEGHSEDRKNLKEMIDEE